MSGVGSDSPQKCGQYISDDSLGRVGQLFPALPFHLFLMKALSVGFVFLCVFPTCVLPVANTNNSWESSRLEVRQRFWPPIVFSQVARETWERRADGRCIEKASRRVIAQWLRVLTALSEDLGSIPSTDMVAHNHLQLQSLGSKAFFY
jgi:hypothetical protein